MKNKMKEDSALLVPVPACLFHACWCFAAQLVGSLNNSFIDNVTQLELNVSVVEILTYLSCNLRALGLQVG